jgi:hypothetical protein
MDISEITNQIGEIENYQATFMTIKAGGQSIRIDFNDKRQFKLSKGTAGQIKYFEVHPLLLDYNEKFATIYINSKANDVEKVTNDIKDAIDSVTLGFRNWVTYVTDKRINFTLDTFLDNLKEGRGKLLEAPMSITNEVEAVCAKYGIATKYFEVNIEPFSYKLITIDINYVIAKEFKISSR